MSRFIDADAIEYHEVFDGDEFVRVAYGDDIDEIPTADVVDRNECSKCVLYPFKQLRERLEANMVEVVPCKYCVNWQKDQSVDLYGSHYCPRMDTRTMEDDYCSYGERREYDGL